MRPRRSAEAPAANPIWPWVEGLGRRPLTRPCVRSRLGSKSCWLVPEAGSSVGGAAPGRVLGLDLGQSRIGVAISDAERRVAVPIGTIRTGAPADVKAIAAIVREEG